MTMKFDDVVIDDVSMGDMFKKINKRLDRIESCLVENAVNEGCEFSVSPALWEAVNNRQEGQQEQTPDTAEEPLKVLFERIGNCEANIRGIDMELKHTLKVGGRQND